MKKLMLLAVVAVMSFTNLYANAALQHANPMPNLVRYALGNAELLQLDKKQVEEIKAWAKENKPKMKAMIKTVMSEERMLRKEALTTDNDVVGKSQKMLDTRKQIIELKTLCRQNLKKVLTKKQYKQVVKIYRSSLPKQVNCKQKK